jgi:signal transduction histidine kinase/DNA-binding response OmpR family regulator/HPt (histidine-containing phosphotransfer) domain-containing protein
MRKALTFREFIVLGLFFSIIIFGMVYLLTIEEEKVDPIFYHEYQGDIYDPDLIRIGLLTDKDASDVNLAWSETISFLESEIINHQFIIVPLLYDDVKAKMVNEEIDFVVVDPSMFVDLAVNYSISSIATMKNYYAENETTSLGSVIFTSSTNNEVTSITDVKNKNLVAANDFSFEGILAAKKEFLDNGIDIDKDLNSLSYVGTYSKVVSDVVNGLYDVGIVRTGIIEEMVKNGTLTLDEISVLNLSNSDFPLALSTQLYPEWSIAKTPHISKDLGYEVAIALLKLEKTDQAAIDLDIAGWTISSNYQDVHTMIKLIGEAPYENYGSISLHNAIYYNRIFLIIILSSLFIIVSITLWLFRTRSELVQITKVSRQMEKIANEANEAKGGFLANMSHEIRTPMSAIIGLSSLLERTGLTIRQHEYNSRLKSSAINLLGIIEDILDYSKIDAKQMKLEKIEFDLYDILYHLSNMIAFKAREKDVDYLFKIQPGLPKRFIGDPLRIGQILINIVNNALKFTNEGQVLLSISSINKNGNSLLLFEVKDTGIGMTNKEINNVINPFIQADSSFTRRYGGTGLGLTITSQIIELMGGKLEITSEKGVGSTFVFELPLDYVKNDTQSFVLPAELRNLKVMIVDDNLSSLEIFEEICDEMMVVSKVVSDPFDAIKVLEDGLFNPDILIVDVNFEGLSGIELIESLEQKDLLENTQSILLVSAWVKEEIIEEATKLGVTRFLDKPVYPSSFYDTIVSLYNTNETKQHSNIVSKKKVNLVKPGTSIILAEDNKINQKIVNELLSNEGFHVTIANNGQEVIDILNLDEFDYKVILMDIQMPVLNGRDATGLIRQMEFKYKDIPIVAMTAHALAVERDKSLSVGMNAFLTKPLEISKLLDVLSKYVDIISVPIDIKNAEGLGLPFLDAKSGLTNVNNNKELYIEMLYQFLNDYRGYDLTLKDIFNKDNVEDIIVEIHRIKGLSSTLGAIEVYTKSLDVELELRKGKHDYSKFSVFIDSLKKLETDLENYFKVNTYTKKKTK